MYDKPFYITEPVSNNAFSYDKRSNKRLSVAAISNGRMDDVTVGDEVVFEDFGEDGELQSCTGLKGFILDRRTGKNIYVFDNHNHAFAFWHLEMIRGRLRPGAVIIHIDQHKDTREPTSYLSAKESQDEQAVFSYTNTVLNVGNFIPAALKTGLASSVINLDSEASIDKYLAEEHRHEDADMILDIDLDIFAPDLDYIPKEKKISAITRAARDAKVITIATSPFFLSTDLALVMLKELSANLPSWFFLASYCRYFTLAKTNGPV